MRFLIITFIAVFVLVSAAVIALILGRPSSVATGLWQTEGYGMYVDIGNLQTQVYEVTETSCQKADLFPSHRGLLLWAEGVSFNAAGDTLTVNADGLYHPITARRVQTLPAACAQPQPADPAAVVEAVYQHFNEHYPFFDLYQVDWQANTDQARARVTPSMTDDALRDALRVQLDGIHDAHVYITNGTTGFSPHPGVSWRDHYDTANAVARGLTDLTCIDDSGLCYGILPGNIGWIRLLGMDADRAGGQATAKAHSHMQTAATALQDTKAILIDNRFNRGGSDDVSLAYAASFSDRSFQPLDKVIVTPAGLSDPLPATVPNLPGIDLMQPVYLINSDFTVSASEVFVLAMRDLPQVQVVGTSTRGALSDILNRQLPNGWQLGLSHQIYRTVNGEVFEGIGIPPDEELPFDLAGFLARQDTQVQTLIARIP